MGAQQHVLLAWYILCSAFICESWCDFFSAGNTTKQSLRSTVSLRIFWCTFSTWLWWSISVNAFCRRCTMSPTVPQVENGSDVNAADNGGSTALHVAVRRGHVPLAAALVRRGGDLTLLDRHGRSPLESVKREQDVQDIAVGHFKAAERNPMLVRNVFFSHPFVLERVDGTGGTGGYVRLRERTRRGFHNICYERGGGGCAFSFERGQNDAPRQDKEE